MSGLAIVINISLSQSIMCCSFMEHSKLMQVAKDDYLPSDAVRKGEERGEGGGGEREGGEREGGRRSGGGGNGNALYPSVTSVVFELVLLTDCTNSVRLLLVRVSEFSTIINSYMHLRIQSV